MPDGRTEPRADNLWRTPPAPLNTSSDFDPYSEMRGASFGARSSGARSRLVLFLGGFAVLFGGAVFAHHWFANGLGSIGDAARSAFSNAPQGTATAEGGASRADAVAGISKPAEQPSTVAAAPAVPTAPPTQGAPAMQTAPAGAGVQSGVPAAATGAAGTGVPNAPVATAQAAPAPAQPAPQTAVAPVVAGTNGAGAVAQPSPSAPRSQPLQSSQPAAAAAGDQVAGTERQLRRAEIRAEVRAADRASARDAGGIASARLLAGARDSLAKNDLSAAHALLSRTSETHGEAAELRDDLRSREAARDAALGSARDCAAQQRWQCAWHNAGNALAIDASSREARALVRRSIVESGAATTPPGPGGGPDVPMLQP